MKKYTTAALCLVIFFTVAIILGCSVYNIKIAPVSKDQTLKEIVVESGDTYYTLATKLGKENLIKSETFFKLYVKLMQPKELVAGKYSLSENMGVKKIISVLENGSGYEEGIIITFKEGLNMRSIASIIAKNTQYSEEDVFDTLKNQDYLNNLINQYWFITDEIKNSKIYYSLEGYLFPDTYEFAKDATVEDILNTMIAEMGKQIEPYRNRIQESDYTFHELLTLASMVELEAATPEDREQVASVFYNRLGIDMTLGSDVTTYYGSKVDMGERDLTISELNDNNPYNTRGNLIGLPIGPICNPGISSIKAAIKPANTDYYYFVADKNHKVYFAKTYEEHNAIINRLGDDNLWYEYQ